MKYKDYPTLPGRLCCGGRLACLIVVVHVAIVCGDEIPAPVPDAPAQVQPALPPVSPESIALFRRGIDSLQAGKFDEAILTLRRTVALEPKHADYHLALASAYGARRRTREAWDHARTAATLSPLNEQAGEAVLSIWQTFDQAGLFNVGGAREALAEKLGEPDQKLEVSGATRLLYAFMAVNLVNEKVDSVMDLRGMHPESPMPEIGVELDWQNDDWQLAHRVVTGRHDTVEYVPKGVRIQEWEELVTIERLYGLAAEDVTVEDLAKEAEQTVSGVDKKAVWRRIDSDESEAWFEATVPKIENRAAQWEVTRIFVDRMGQREDFVRATYLNREEELAVSQRKHWAQFLKAIK